MKNYLKTVACLGVLLFGCSSPDETTVIGGDDGEDGGDGGSIPGNSDSENEPTTREAEGCNRMDILFVIDDSGSMSGKQTNLGENFPNFFEVIENYETKAGELLDFHLGVTTSGVTKYRVNTSGSNAGLPRTFQVGADGDLVSGACGLERGFISRETENSDELFGCVADVGTSGPAVEMPLEALRLSVGKQYMEGNTSEFYREDALLGIVILTDEDDCSYKEPALGDGYSSSCSGDALFPPAAYVAAVDQFKGQRARWAAAVISGGSSGCRSNEGNGSAVATPRLSKFVAEIGSNAIESSICEADLSGALQDALDTFDTACENFPVPE